MNPYQLFFLVLPFAIVGFLVLGLLSYLVWAAIIRPSLQEWRRNRTRRNRLFKGCL